MKKNHSIDQLLEACKKGERKAQERLYSALAPKMYGLCMRYAKNDHEAQEVLQLGFIKMFRGLHSFRGTGSFEGWVRRIMINIAIEKFHKSKENNDWVDIDSLHHLADDSLEVAELEVQDLLKLIRTLPEGFKMVFNMYAIEGYSHKEIAESLNISIGTSKSQLSRARIWLKEKIKTMEGELWNQ